MTIDGRTIPVKAADSGFDPESPPLLDGSNASKLINASPVYGATTTVAMTTEFDIWGELKARGANFVDIPDSPIMLSVILDGTAYPQLGKSHVNVGTPFPFKSELNVTEVWRMNGMPEHTARDGTDEVSQTYSSTIDEMQSVESNLTRSVEATVGAEGFGMSASVTASLSNSVTKMKSISKSTSEQTTKTWSRDVVAGHTYVTWQKYNRIDLTIMPEYANPPYEPFSQDLINAVLPKTITCFAPLQSFGDCYPPLDDKPAKPA
ncbi:MAG: hypothetical protein JSS36_00725 [Proteobacteria bacterium]|nr:hypothetical protein [Pseudomonadota bacterium]